MIHALINRINKNLLAGAAAVGVVLMAYLVYSRPGYLTSKVYLGGVLLLELLAVSVFLYQRIFFPVTLLSFLLAGVDLPVGPGWTTARWLFLGVGAWVGSIMVLKQRVFRFGFFHAVAFFTVMAAFISAAVSSYPEIAFLKSCSLLLLFVYGATGVRIAVMGRESRFFEGLLVGCEIFVAATMAFHLIGIEAMGNPNSLGAVMGVVAAPILLWGLLLDEKPRVRQRRLVIYVLCLYLLFSSYSRAGLSAAVLSTAILTVGLRRYKALAQGIAVFLVVVSAVALLAPEVFSRHIESFENRIVYKGGGRDQGILASRASPWQSAVDTIRNHFWFGTGFGTGDNGTDATEHLGRLASSADIDIEHGSSYLAIAAWVGVLGGVPFAVLLIVLLAIAVRSVFWMVRTMNPCHPAVPLATVILAGLAHACFEDWLFAPGNYLCVFFWSMAFILVDSSPMLALTNAQSVQATQLRFARNG